MNCRPPIQLTNLYPLPTDLTTAHYLFSSALTITRFPWTSTTSIGEPR